MENGKLIIKSKTKEKRKDVTVETQKIKQNIIKMKWKLSETNPPNNILN